MKRIIACGIAALALVGCGGTNTRMERLNGVECVVRRNAYQRPTVFDCNWDEYNERQGRGSPG